MEALRKALPGETRCRACRRHVKPLSRGRALTHFHFWEDFLVMCPGSRRPVVSDEPAAQRPSASSLEAEVAVPLKEQK